LAYKDTKLFAFIQEKAAKVWKLRIFFMYRGKMGLSPSQSLEMPLYKGAEQNF
jgi:hypothetical protein